MWFLNRSDTKRALEVSHLMRKPTICICENKDADQLRGYREDDQRLCFRYLDSTIPLLRKSEISSVKLFSVLVQAGLCRNCSETTLLVFPRGGSSIEDGSRLEIVVLERRGIVLSHPSDIPLCACLRYFCLSTSRFKLSQNANHFCS